jgi:hypothetical protein
VKAQTRKGAAIESGVNLVVGFSMSWLINYIALVWWKLPPTAALLIALGGAITIASVIRSFVVRRIFEGLRIRQAPPAFLYIVEELADERQRQIRGEGYDLAHDDQYTSGELQRAAGWYALASASYVSDGGPLSFEPLFDDLDYGWPWEAEFWKSTAERRDLVKAGALLIAAIGRIDRANGRRA